MILILTSDAIVDFILIKLAEAMIYTFPRVRTNWGKQTFIYQASKDWNNLDNNIKSSESMSFFKAKLKSLYCK